jgi:hypothetical protein
MILILREAVTGWMALFIQLFLLINIRSGGSSIVTCFVYGFTVHLFTIK